MEEKVITEEELKEIEIEENEEIDTMGRGEVDEQE